MRLDHLLSKEKKRSRELLSIVELSGRVKKEVLRANGSKGPRRDRRTKLRSKARKDLAKNSSFFGGDASGGNTRSHPEHDG